MKGHIILPRFIEITALRIWWSLFLVTIVVMGSRPVLADSGDISVGAHWEVAVPLSSEATKSGIGAGPGVALRFGLSDWLSVRSELGLELGPEREGLVRLGGQVLGSLDVLRWVPEVGVGLEGVVGQQLAAMVCVGARYYLTMATSAGLDLRLRLVDFFRAGGDSSFEGVVRASVSFDFF